MVQNGQNNKEDIQNVLMIDWHVFNDGHLTLTKN
jgi:hypothetical protein